MVGVYKCWRFKGSEDVKVLCQEEAMDVKVQFWEGAMVGGHKWGRFERSDDAKVQIWEGVIMAGVSM